MRRIILAIFLVLVIILGDYYYLPRESINSPNINEIKFVETFEVNSINDEIYNKIYNKSWKENAPVTISDLRYIVVSYWGFDDKPHIGEIIVNKSVAEDIKDIFKELFYLKYPIDKIKLIDEYNAIDEASMNDNNTSSFCFRPQSNSTKLSVHSYGLAIDINPLQNPYVKGNVIQPAAAKEYTDRSIIKKGMILKDDPCYKAFTSRGWTWGGEWNGMKDYQHFEKNFK